MGEIWESSNEAMLFLMLEGGMDTKVLALCLPSFCESNLSERKFDRKLRSFTLWDAEMADQSLTQVSRQRAQASARRDGFGNINVIHLDIHV
jgi:hypothetical protein